MQDINKTVICAMSGGVDSSVAALLLKQQGYNVIGVTMKLWECFKNPEKQMCCSPLDVDDARSVCEQIGIKHHVLDLRQEFKKLVVDYFAEEYSRGRTPNPCIKCNEVVKFELLREKTLELFDTDIIATGHHARIELRSHCEVEDRSNLVNSLDCFANARNDMKYRLLKGKDPQKDQSYFLFTLTKDQMERTLFPVGGMTKDEVREVASGAGLKTSKKRESQDICFIVDGDYAGFINDFYPDLAKPSGNFVDESGKILGKHEGSHAYTIGQRRGLGFGFGKRKYVVKVDPEKNEVLLGDDEDLYGKEMVVDAIDRAIVLSCYREKKLNVKIRYRHDGAKVKLVEEGDSIKVIFDEAQRAITPGQAAVFYDGDEVVGGGWILKTVNCES